MQFQRHISRRLHEEHTNALGLLEQFEKILTGRKGPWPPAPDDDAWRAFASKLAEALHNEVASHFALEEDALFGPLTDAGNGDLVELLPLRVSLLGFSVYRLRAASFPEVHR
jgi:iron-sulfur cluster repair protein YtfE (RIC family)